MLNFTQIILLFHVQITKRFDIFLNVTITKSQFIFIPTCILFLPYFFPVFIFNKYSPLIFLMTVIFKLLHKLLNKTKDFEIFSKLNFAVSLL